MSRSVGGRGQGAELVGGEVERIGVTVLCRILCVTTFSSNLLRHLRRATVL